MLGGEDDLRMKIMTIGLEFRSGQCKNVGCRIGNLGHRGRAARVGRWVSSSDITVNQKVWRPVSELLRIIPLN